MSVAQDQAFNHGEHSFIRAIFFCERRTRDQIEAERAPQILKIDHDDAVSLSGDDESLNSDSDDDLSSGYHSNRSRQLQSGKNLLAW